MDISKIFKRQFQSRTTHQNTNSRFYLGAHNLFSYEFLTRLTVSERKSHPVEQASSLIRAVFCSQNIPLTDASGTDFFQFCLRVNFIHKVLHSQLLFSCQNISQMSLFQNWFSEQLFKIHLHLFPTQILFIYNPQFPTHIFISQ